MITQFKLVGLSKPHSATVEFFDKPDESFNIPMESQNNGLWNYCKDNWDSVKLKVVVQHDGFGTDKLPLNPVAIKVLPIEPIDYSINTVYA